MRCLSAAPFLTEQQWVHQERLQPLSPCAHLGTRQWRKMCVMRRAKSDFFLPGISGMGPLHLSLVGYLCSVFNAPPQYLGDLALAKLSSEMTPVIHCLFEILRCAESVWQWCHKMGDPTCTNKDEDEVTMRQRICSNHKAISLVVKARIRAVWFDSHTTILFIHFSFVTEQKMILHISRNRCVHDGARLTQDCFDSCLA